MKTADPSIPMDNTDRNRTSPLAFTGNKFEFRMLGSTQSIAGPNIALNTMMAEELSQFADRLEASSDFQGDLQKLIRETLTEHRRIIFNGNGYEDAWIEEAERRGLANLKTTAEALPHYTDPEHVALFTKHGVFTAQEMAARQEIHMENYCTVLSIEATTMVDMLRHEILPAVSNYGAVLCNRLHTLKEAGLPCRYEQSIAMRVTEKTDALADITEELETALAQVPSGSTEEQMHYYHNVIFALMGKARVLADEMEQITDRDYWPFPTYSTLLFSV